MIAHLEEVFANIKTKGAVTAKDVIDLRRYVFADSFVATNEANRLFDLNDLDIPKSECWADFFVATITTLLVRQTRPHGYVDEDTAKWFIKRISHDGHIQTETELRSLLSVLDIAKNATDTLAEFALSEVRAAILYSEGYMGSTRNSTAKKISRDDVVMIERVLYASGGDNNVKVTVKEAEILFDLNDVCEAEDDAAELWQDIFVNAVTNCVMFYAVFKNPSREEALRQEKWIQSRGDLNIGGLIHQVTPQDVWDSFSGKDHKEQQKRSLIEKQMTRHEERIDAEESLWLTRRIARDGVLNANERALLRNLEKLSPDVHQSLRDFIAAA